jgi:tRNA 2-thiouridine synthesizing protein A
MTQAYDVLLQVHGLRCPMPLLKTKQALSSMNSGQVLKIEATDAGSWRDIPAFVDLTTHQLLTQEQNDEQYIFYILKGN